ncbi:MAG: hypothetical protein DDT26_01537 [Dehalococcoidia bacterium]|nr:hypothetical protein [Chloroflexota bacterium]
MSITPEEIDQQLARVREALQALEQNAEQTILSGEAAPAGWGARLAILADGSGHIWHAADPEASNEAMAQVVDALITHLEYFRDRLRDTAANGTGTAH